MVDPDIEAVGRLVVKARLKKGWDQLQFSKEMGIFHYLVVKLEAGEEWPDEETAEVMEETLGWYPGALTHLKELGEFMNLDEVSLAAFELQTIGSAAHQQQIHDALLRSQADADTKDPWKAVRPTSWGAGPAV